ncbi:unnamed protein product [Sympodiomycopsis kandeliae]
MDGLFDANDANAAAATGSLPIPTSTSQRSVFPAWNEADEDAYASLAERTRHRANSRARDPQPSSRRSHSRGLSDDSRARSQEPSSARGIGFPSTSSQQQQQQQYSNEDEVEGYLPPMNGPSRRHRQRYDSVDSWGSSVMPAALPVRQAAGGYASHRSSKARQRNEQQQQHNDSRPAGTEGWVEATSRLAVPQTDPMVGSSSNRFYAGPPSPQRPHSNFQSFAPSGRLRRVDSDAASAAEGSLGGWSTGVLSAGGRKYQKHPSNKGSLSKDPTRARSKTPIWEDGPGHNKHQRSTSNGSDVFQESNATSPLDSVLQWRQSSAIPPGSSPPDHSIGRPENAAKNDLRSRKKSSRQRPSSSGGRPGSVTESVLPASFSRQSLRNKDLLDAPPLPNFKSSIQAGLAAAVSTPRPTATPVRTFVRGMMKEGLSARAVVALGLVLSVISKWALGAGGGWSGDTRVGWDTLRHWMALTTNLPFEEWYTFDVDHHLLTRPPLAAWWLFLQGKLAKTFFPHLAPSFTFPPAESSPTSASAHTYLVVSQILTTDLLYIFPTLFFLSRRLKDRGRRTKAIASISVLLQPALLLVDYGLGDFRSLGLGFCAASLALLYTTLPNPDVEGQETGVSRTSRIFTLSRRVSTDYVLATAFFVLSILLDQSVLLMAPVVLAVVFGRLIGLASVRISRGLTFLNWIAGLSIAAITLPLLPWLLPVVIGRSRESAISSLQDMLSRLAAGSNWTPTKSKKLHLPRVLQMPDHANHVSTTTSILSQIGGRLGLDHADKLYQLQCAVALLLCAWPCLILARAAKETVLIENFLNQGATDVKTESKKLSPAGVPRSSSSVLNTPRKSEAGMSSVASVKRNGKPSNTHATANPPAPISEAGSDLRSFAESIVRGGTQDQKANAAQEKDIRDQGDGDEGDDGPRSGMKVSSSCPSPSAAVLPYVSSAVSLGLWLFWPGTTSGFFSSTILAPLLPLTLLTVCKGDSWGGGGTSSDFEWSMLANNVATFSLWTSIRSDGLPLQYVVVVVLWNWLVGHRPLQADGFKKWVHVAMLAVHGVSLFDAVTAGKLSIPVELLVQAVSLPALFAVWIRAMKRIAEVGVGNGLSLGLL